MIPHAKIRSALRRIWLFEPGHDRVKKRARLSIGLYRCEKCGSHVKKVQIDHKEAIGSTPGSKFATSEDNWDRFINRLFCDDLCLQVICIPCHEAISKQQRAKRKWISKT